MKYGKRDGNQATIQRDLAALGYPTHDTSGVGGGFPDLVVLVACVCGGGVELLECKDPRTSYGRRGFNRNQRAFVRRGWPVETARGHEDVVRLADAWKTKHDGCVVKGKK